MFRYKVNPNPENFTPSRMVWMVTFCKSVISPCHCITEQKLMCIRAAESRERDYYGLVPWWKTKVNEGTYYMVNQHFPLSPSNSGMVVHRPMSIPKKGLVNAGEVW